MPAPGGAGEGGPWLCSSSQALPALRRPAAAVAIARALVNQPRVLLLDEPLGAPDLKLREQMQVELKKLQQSLGITFIFVTHDQSEALSMSDRVAVFNNGRIEQVDAPQDLYLHPGPHLWPVLSAPPTFCSRGGPTIVRDGGQLVAASGACSPAGRRRGAGAGCGAGGAVSGAATRIELRLADGDKLLVSRANIDGAAAASVPRTGQIVQASWSRSAMTPLESGG